METQVTEATISYKSKVKPSERAQIKEAEDAVKIFKAIAEYNDNLEYKEMFYCMYLNRANKVLSVIKISEGGTTGTVVDVKHVMQGAILQNASAIILSHNHPSGNLKPSVADNDLTKKIKEAAKLFDVALIDHIIITSENKFFYSFANESSIL